MFSYKTYNQFIKASPHQTLVVYNSSYTMRTCGLPNIYTLEIQVYTIATAQLKLDTHFGLHMSVHRLYLSY